MKRLVLIPVVALAVLASSCSSLAVAAATVNGQKITESEVESEIDVLRDDPIFGEALRRDPDTRGQRRREILQELVYQAVAAQEASRLKIRITQKQTDALIQQAAMARGTSVDEFLAAENLTRAQARRLAERGVRRFELIEKVVKDVDVDNDTVRDVYEGQQDRFVEVHLERITVATEADAKKVLDAVDTGQTFSSVASDLSRDDLAARGGDMGYVPLTGLDVEVQSAVGRAETGGLTDPIEGPGGFEIYRLVDRRTKPFEDVEAEITDALSQQERDNVYQEWLGDKVRDARIVVNPKYGRLDKQQPQPAIVASTGELAD